MKTMDKMIAAMTLMSIITMPAMAGNKNNPRNDRNNKAVVVNNHKGGSHFDKNDRTWSHHDAHKPHAYRPEVKTCTFKLSRREYQKNAISKVEHMKGVLNTKWNPRTRELTIIYDAKITSARNIKHFMA